MTYTLFSFSVFLICALFIGVEINRSLRRGLSNTLISFASLFASIIVGVFLSRIVASLAGRWLIGLAKESMFSGGYIGGSINMETICLMLIDAFIGSILFFFTFLLVRLFIAIIVGIIVRSKMPPKREERVRHDRTKEARRERAVSVVAGALSGVLLAAALTSPVIGAFGLMQSAVVIVDETKLNIWQAFDVEQEQVKSLTGYSRNFPTVFLSVAGGKMIYTASATATVDGKLISIPVEMRVLEREIENLGRIIELFQSEEALTDEDIEILDSVCRLAEDSYIFRYFLAEYIQQGASTWLKNGSFMNVPYPNVTSHFRELFDEVLRICSGTSAHTVSDDIRTMTNIYAHMLKCGRDYDDVLAAVTDSDVMTDISNELRANSRMNNSVIRGELYSLVVYSMSAQMARGGVDITNIQSFYAFAGEAATIVNQTVGNGKLTRDEMILQVADNLGTTFAKLGMNFSDSAVLLVAESLIDRFGRGADPATAEDIAVFFGARLVQSDNDNSVVVPESKG